MEASFSRPTQQGIVIIKDRFVISPSIAGLFQTANGRKILLMTSRLSKSASAFASAHCVDTKFHRQVRERLAEDIWSTVAR